MNTRYKNFLDRMMCFFGFHRWNYSESHGFPPMKEPTSCKVCNKVFVPKNWWYDSGTPFG